MHPPANKILSVNDHRAVDTFAAANGAPGPVLMENAGAAVSREIMARWSPRRALILCGPGNNGGDGFVIARHLQAAGWPVVVSLYADREAYRGDAAAMLAKWTGPCLPIAKTGLDGCDLVVDALFGAGLSRPLARDAFRLAHQAADYDVPFVAVDVPSGVDGDLGKPQGCAFKADLTVTFHRFKAAHLLELGRSLCGEIVLADIGIPEGWEAEAEPLATVNGPDLWPALPRLSPRTIHKHQRGRLCVVSGPASATGAARLAAEAGLRAGAGLVTLLSPPGALQVNAMHLTEVMLQRFEGVEGLLQALDDRRATAAVIGPGCGVGAETKELVIAATAREAALVLDADALTSFEGDADHLFSHLRANDVLTPHDGEFRRLFPDLFGFERSKIERVRLAAKQAGCTIICKGPDTVIASPGGEVRVNVHADPALATAGAGDVLAGMIGGLLARGASGLDAASAAVWLHGDAGIRRGTGLIAGDLPDILPEVFADLARRRRIFAMRAALNARHNNA
ncbi:MAG: NAD(P)H-hydrate dehydratase [Alphaproteobacteria bacterium]|nr:NAD(P)H-hydrate dehydratase [Alphaproteobacteria bacterium]